MCGIVAYLGNNPVYPILIQCLEYLEYRGYDSIGISILQNNIINTIKTVGKLHNLTTMINEKKLDIQGTVGIGHNRWATHGNITLENTHPHMSNQNHFSLVHNGIIENYKVLKNILETRGYTFTSQTDTETIVHLIDNIQQIENLDFEIAIQKCMKQIIGAYSIILLHRDSPDTLFVAKNSSPLIIGFTNDYSEYIVASDIKCISQYVTNIIYLDDKSVAKLTKGQAPQIYNMNDKLITPFIEELQLEIQINDKHGFEYYLLKEIYEQPMSIVNSIRGRINTNTWNINLGGLYNSHNILCSANTFTFIGCGTSFNACLLAEFLFEAILQIPCKAINASEYRYKKELIKNPNEIVVAISQSGETADTIAAVNLAKNNGIFTLGICNVISSTIARITHCGCYIHAGPEISVASTKAFTSQICIIMLIILYIKSDFLLAIELYNIAGKILNIIDTQERNIKELAKKLYQSEHILFLGRGILYPVALESALKFKELTYIHAEGILTSELKHGPLAMINETIPIIVFANKCSTYNKTLSCIEEIHARGGNVIVIKTIGDDNIEDDGICVPEVSEYFLPFVSIIPIQLLAYHVALLKHVDIDTPRNIAKSVTVE